MDWQSDRKRCVEWARELLSRPLGEVVIYDSESTGLLRDGPVEILQIGLIRTDGSVVLDSLVKPRWTDTGLTCIPPTATAIHGITDEMVSNAPRLSAFLPEMARAMHGKTVVIYNRGYDHGVLWHCLHRRHCAQIRDQRERDIVDGCPAFSTTVETEGDRCTANWMDRVVSWECAMLQYAAFVGERGRFGGYRWQKLPAAGEDAHTAIGDCRSTLEVIRRMAAFE